QRLAIEVPIARSFSPGFVPLNGVGAAIGNIHARGHALPPVSKGMAGRVAPIVEAGLLTNPAREMVHRALGRMALATTGGATVEKGAALLLVHEIEEPRRNKRVVAVAVAIEGPPRVYPGHVYRSARFSLQVQCA